MVPCLGRSSATLQVLVPSPSCYTHVYSHRNARNVQPAATDQLLASFALSLQKAICWAFSFQGQQGSHHESSFLLKCPRGPANSQELGPHYSFSCSPLWVDLDAVSQNSHVGDLVPAPQKEIRFGNSATGSFRVKAQAQEAPTNSSSGEEQP